MKVVWAVFKRELQIGIRRWADVLWPLVFFFVVITIFPLGVSPDKDILSVMAPGVIWAAALIASLLSMEKMLLRDLENGTLDWMLLSPEPTSSMLLAKALAHWVMHALPLVISSPLVGIMLGLSPPAIEALVYLLLLGTPVLVLMGMTGVAMTLYLKRGAMLLVLLVMPLCVPVLILGTSGVREAMVGGAYSGHLLWLASLDAVAFVVLPLAAATGLRISSGQ